MSLPEALRRGLEHQVAERQVEHRIPGLVVGVARDGRLVWEAAVGAGDVARPDEPPSADTQFAIGSITKTFTATLVMALRDEGRLDLDDPLAKHLGETRHGSVTLREMLAHASGLQREPEGDVWDELELPDSDRLLAGFEEAEQVLPARSRWHYSNLAYSLLGQVVARVDGRAWEESLAQRILQPLGMRRTTLQPEAPAAVGYLTEPFTDQVQRQPVADLKAMAPAGTLWSTLTDLATWSGCLAGGHQRVLRSDSVAEMAQVQILADIHKWQLAWGLGLELFRRGERVLVGHTGGMPGFLTGLAVDRDSRTGAVVLANAIGDFDPGDLACTVLERVLEEDPQPPQPWRPGPPVPEDLAALVGRWWSEGSPFEFFVRDATLHARAEAAPKTMPPAVFERLDATTFRTVSGREQGELLRVHFDGDAVTHMHWATYRVSREPESFAAVTQPTSEEQATRG